MPSRGHEVCEEVLELYVAERTWSEAQHEVRRRATIIAQQGRIAPGTGDVLATAAIMVITTYIRQGPAVADTAREANARSRIPRERDDWPTVAAALVPRRFR
jgi:PIN domain